MPLLWYYVYKLELSFFLDNVHVPAAKRTSGHSPLERDLEMKNTMQVYLTNAVQHVINNINSTWWYDFSYFVYLYKIINCFYPR